MRTVRLFRHFLILAVVAVCSHALGEVKLPSVFGDHMVLQRGVSAPVWGWADPEEEITVRFAGQKQQATADRLGQWMVRLNRMKANNDGQLLEVSGTNKVSFRDVLIGDVWICSGQSNMEWPVAASLDAQKELAAAQYPTIRLFDVQRHVTSPLPRTDLPGTWAVCSPQSVKGFSAVGFYFGRHLHSEGGVPIGLIGTNWGGTRIEPWAPPIGFRSVPELKALASQVDRFDPIVVEGRTTWEDYCKDVEAWILRARKALQMKAPLPAPVQMPGFAGGGDPTAIYNAMVHPLVPYGIRGAIWYQGESNGGEGVEYFHKMRALVEGWRSVWNQDSFPIHFYFVQLANWQNPNDSPAGGDGWARIREAQRRALTIPHTGMAVTIDIGQAGDIHPRNKQDVGVRLARWALRDVHKQQVVVSGPLYRRMKVEGSKIRVSFDHVGGGLIVGEKKGVAATQEVENGKLKRFAIAGEDRNWHWAEAQIEEGTVVVWSDEVPQP
ncbi:MAG: sialate O-acetylesterase, partial [Planctomycetota bacterium]